MSVLLAAVATHIATATPIPSPLPSPSPTIINHVVTVIKTIPLVSAMQLFLLFLVGAGGSILHEIAEKLSKSQWGRSLNTFITFAYGITTSAVATYLMGDLHANWNSVFDFLTNLLLVLGSSQGRYAFTKWVSSLGTSSIDEDPITPQIAASDTQVAATVPTKASI